MPGRDQGCRGKPAYSHLSAAHHLPIATLQKKVGTLPKDTTTGPFADDWKHAFGDISKDVEEVDITPALSAAFAIKDPDELVSLVFTVIKYQILTNLAGFDSKRLQGVQWPDVRILCR